MPDDDASAPFLTDGPASVVAGPISVGPIAYATPATGSAPTMSVAQSATRGMVWMTVASLVCKVVGFAQLIVLAWFLKVEDFGLLTMATTVVAFVNLPFRFSLEEILVQRYRRFDLWKSPAFWLSIASGGATMALLLVAAPLGAWFYGNWRVSLLMVIFAATSPVTAAMAVPSAKLSAELRFGVHASLSIVQILVQAIVALPLAALGCGAMSIAIASLSAAAATTICAWSIARVGPLGRPQARRWRYFIRDSGMLQASRFATAISANADFIVVGRFAGTAQLGIYSYAYNQSLQAMRLVAANAAGVLFPSLSSFGDDVPRKYAAFLRGLRLVMPLLVPFCLLQAALADPAFRLLFKPAYWPGVPLFQILSFGTVGVGAVTLAHSYVLSLRRNDLSFANSAGSAACFVALVPLGWAIGHTTGVAVAVSVTGAVSLAFAHAIAARASGQPFAPAAWLYARPTLLGLISCAVPWAIVTFAMPRDRHAALARLVAGALAFAIMYPPLLRAISRPTFVEIATRLPLPPGVARWLAAG